MDADVAVVGVGTMGSMAAWQLAKRGISVLGFEQFGTGHDRSAAGGESRLFRTAYMEGAQYVPLLQEAQTQWRKLEKETGNNLLTLNGGLMIGEPDLEVMKNVRQSMEQFDLDGDVFEKREAYKRYPQHRLFSGEIMIFDKNAGFLRPELAVVSAVQRAEALGATIHRYTKVETISTDNNGVTIEAQGTKYRVGKVLITTGPWTQEFLPEMNNLIKARRLVLTWFAPKNMEQFKPKNFPIFARMYNDYRLTGAPVIDGSMVKASNTKNPEKVQPSEGLNRNVRMEEIIEVGQSVQTLIPELIPDPVRASVYMDSYTFDGHSLVGHVPGFKNTVLMSGFSGHGFKMAPVFGKIAADLIIDGKTNHPINHLNPVRYKQIDV